MRGKLRIYLGPAPGVGKTYAMLDEGWRRRERGTDVVIGLVVTHDRPQTIAQIRDLEIVPPRRTSCIAAACGTRSTSTRSSPGGRRSCSSTSSRTRNVPGSAQREALAGHRGAARRRHRGHLDGEHPAPRERQRRRQSHHRRGPARDGSRLGGAARRSDRARRHEPGGAATPDGARQHLPAREGRRRARQLLPPRQPRRAARARVAVGRRSGRGLAAGLHGPARHHELVGDARAGARRGDGRAGRRRSHPPGRTDGPPHQGRSDRRARREQRRAHAPEARARSRGTRSCSRSSVAAGTTSTGDDVPATLVAFATAQHATQIVLGTSSRSRWTELTQGSIINRVVREAKGIDVHVIATDDASATEVSPAAPVPVASAYRPGAAGRARSSSPRSRWSLLGAARRPQLRVGSAPRRRADVERRPAHVPRRRRRGRGDRRPDPGRRDGAGRARARRLVPDPAVPVVRDRARFRRRVPRRRSW